VPPSEGGRPEDWLTNDGSAPNLAGLASPPRPQVAALLAVMLAEELWRVAGPDAAALLRVALAESFPLAVETVPP
jgi:hypothetical protein